MTLDAAAKIGPELALKLPLRAVKTMRSIMSLVRRTAEDIVTEHEHDGAPKDDMLQVLINSDNFSHKQLVDEVVHFLAAATETTAGSIVWGIHLLSRHPDMQSRLREELHSHIPSISYLTNDDISSTLENMPYLNAIIKEILRFHSMNTILWRQCISSTANICGHHIPIGTKLTFSPWALQRDPAHWGPDARTFNPERWLIDPISGGADHSYSFLNFGAGPRRCIGETYAKVQMRCMLSAMIGAFEWAPINVDKESDVGEEIGDNHALTLFKILEGWKLNCKKVDGWV
ncbi:Cytochrome P450 monooxygenase [Pseudocercospora fuligena]|uniref:Cytochrome P450 monooxygenase n=1 Tax=Pseudocercospora fuligena TaxID=685502 RepID=A0A8H6R655_9PEZI|nr:Cytochrome P450 monooxygenase [Pseudocercospora fuligena]